MIAKIGAKRSGHPGRLISYLYGPGKANEHTNPRTIAGSVHYPDAGVEARAQVTADLQWAQQAWPEVQFTGGHIWHCSLALGADEGRISDDRWQAIAEDFMREMDLTSPAKAPLRWTAVHHGLSKEGNDHVHIVASLIREDGTKANIWQDRIRAKRILPEIEQRHGLTVLQSRLVPNGAGAVPYTAPEVAQSRKTGKPIERVELERMVRAAAAASATEAEFVRRLREADIRVRPYPPTGPVSGYSVGLQPPPNAPPHFFQGGQLGRDLTLPRLRGSWPDAGGSRDAASAEWRANVIVQPRPAAPPTADLSQLESALQALAALDTDLQLARPAEFAELSQDLAGSLAAAARVAPQAQRRMLGRATREVGAWAGTRKPVARRGPSRTQLVAQLLLHALDPESEWSRAFMQRRLIESIMQVLQTHRAVRPVAGAMYGGGGRMAEPSDDVDGALTDALTVTATTAMTVAAANRADRDRRLQAARSATLGFFGRFSRQGDEPMRATTPVPAGYREVFAQHEWDALSAAQRKSLDPDNIGRHPTDISPDRPETGPRLRSTWTQVRLAEALGDHGGVGGKGAVVAALDRASAAAAIVKLEQAFTPAQLDEIYSEVGLSMRRVVDDHGVHYTSVQPQTVAPADAVAPAVVVTKTAAPQAPAQQPKAPSDPLKWRTATAPVTEGQIYRLGQLGFSAQDIRGINKGWASVVINAHEADGDEAAHGAMDRALAAMERVTPSTPSASAQPTAASAQQPKPRQL